MRTMWLALLIFLSIVIRVITIEDIPVAICLIEGSSLRTPRISKKNSFLGLLSSGNVLVDKTLLIKHLIDKGNRVSVLVAPTKFGKSINLSMLKLFFEITVDEDGNPIARRKSNNYKLFVYGRMVVDYVLLTLRSPLMISDYKDVIDKYQGKYPVIYLDLCNVTAKSFQGYFDRFKSCVAETFKKHDYMLNVLRKKINENPGKKGEKNYLKFSRILDASGNVSVADIKTSVRFLSELLKEHFNSSSIVLIDEYDLPFSTMLMNEPFTWQDKKLNLLIDFLEHSLTKNENFEKAVLSGSLKLANGIVFVNRSDIYNVHVFSDRELSSFYGFREAEVNGLLDAARISMTKSRDYIYKFFKGYVVGERRIYNPYSITEFIDQQGFVNYWRASVYVDSFIKKNLWYVEFQNLLLNFAYGMSKKIDLRNWEISEQDTRNFVTVLSKRKQNATMNEEEMESAVRLLCSGGYLTEVSSTKNYSLVACPNEEVKIKLKKKLYAYFKKVPLRELTPVKARRVRMIIARLKKDQMECQNIQDTFFYRNYSFDVRMMLENFIGMCSKMMIEIVPLLH